MVSGCYFFALSGVFCMFRLNQFVKTDAKNKIHDKSPQKNIPFRCIFILGNAGFWPSTRRCYA
jgi:hypothetical protein